MNKPKLFPGVAKLIVAFLVLVPLIGIFQGGMTSVLSLLLLSPACAFIVWRMYRGRRQVIEQWERENDPQNFRQQSTPVANAPTLSANREIH